MRLRPNSVCVYPYRSGGVSKRVMERLREQRKFDVSMKRVISATSIRKIRKASEYLNYINIDKFKTWGEGKGKSHYRLIFVTLTLSSPQIHTDNEIKMFCLQPFLESLQKTHNVRNYIWRAEKQQNGNIHLHLIVDIWIEWWAIRNLWNRCQNKLGYIDRFAEREGHFNPNSTDVSAILNSGQAAKYISKYISKSKTPDEIQGRHWGCDYMLSRVQDYKIRSSSIKFSLVMDYFSQNHVKPTILENCSIFNCDLWNLATGLLHRFDWSLFEEFRKIGWFFSEHLKCLIIDKNFQRVKKKNGVVASENRGCAKNIQENGRGCKSSKNVKNNMTTQPQLELSYKY